MKYSYLGAVSIYIKETCRIIFQIQWPIADICHGGVMRGEYIKLVYICVITA